MIRILVLVGLLAALAIGNLYKFSFFSPDLRFSPLDGVLIILTGYTVLSNFRRWLNTIRTYKRIFNPVISFVFLSLISLIFANFNYGFRAVMVGSMYLVRWIGYSMFLATIIQLIKVHDLRRFITVVGLVFTITGLIQYIVLPDIRNFQPGQWDEHYYRVVGTLFDPGFMGLVLLFTLLWLSLNPLKNRLINIISWGLTYVAFVLTYSRSSYLAYLVAMAYLSVKRKDWKFGLMMVLLLLVSVPLLPRAPDGEGVKLERTSSIKARIDNWNHGLRIFADHPLIGVGFNTYRYAQREYGFITEDSWAETHAGAGADSSLLLVAATTGVIGLAFYVNYLWQLWRIMDLRPFVAALIVHSFFLNSLFYPVVLLWLALLMGYMLRSFPFGSDYQPDRER